MQQCPKKVGRKGKEYNGHDGGPYPKACSNAKIYLLLNHTYFYILSIKHDSLDDLWPIPFKNKYNENRYRCR